MKKQIALTAGLCFIAGLAIGRYGLSCPKDSNRLPPLMPRLSSEGRAALKNMMIEMDAFIQKDLGEIVADRTRMLLAITARKPNRTEANFHAAGMENKMSVAQANADKILLDAIEKMPLNDRRTYMKYHLKIKNSLKWRMVVLPFMAETVEESPASVPAGSIPLGKTFGVDNIKK